MEVKTTDYNGKERRNGGCLRLSIHDYIKILVTVFAILVTGVTFYIKTNMTVKALAEDAEASIKTNKRQDEGILTIKSDIKYILKDGEEMKEKQTEMNEKIEEGNKLLYRILGKLETE